jgi:thioredoxin-related protein
MKVILTLIVYCIPYISIAQSKGIRWENKLTWEEVKQKATTENKNIFLDCYTTWCGPCKAMDKYVFSNDTVALYFNDHFISVKVQMDRTKNDESNVRQWYDTADAMSERYKITSFPSFVFLSAEGQVVHKETGYKPVQEFIKVAETALEPGRVYNDPFVRYDSLVVEYKKGKKDYSQMPYMLEQARKANEVDIFKELHREYKAYLEKRDSETWYKKENIEFISSFVKSDSKFFRLFYPDGRRVDKIMGHPGYAAKVVDQIIYKEILKGFGIENRAGGVFWGGGKIDSAEANWNKIYKAIKKQFNKYYAERNLIIAKKNWYLQHNNFPAAAKSYFLKLKKYGIDTVQRFPGFVDLMEHVVLNSYAWESFRWLEDKELLQEAINWMPEVVKKDYTGLYTDTYANLLYKVGEKKKAIQWQQKALELAIKNDYKLDIEEFGERLNKMKQDKRTWKRP